MKKKLVFIFTILLSNCILLSCDDKEDTLPAPKSKEENIHWGYFKGVINKKEFSLENAEYSEKTGYPYNNPVRSGMRIIYFPEGQNDTPVVAIPTQVDFEENAVIYIYLCGLNSGVRYLTNSYYEDWDNSRINLYYTKMVSETESVRESRYITKESNPFRVEIIDLTWIENMKPILDVKIDGTLYNEKIPTDSITIHATYGTRS